VAVGIEPDVVAGDVERGVLGLVHVRLDAEELGVELLGGREVLDG
jgi:hypothetical protein